MNTGAERPKLQVMVVCNRKVDLKVLALGVKAPQRMMLHLEEDRHNLSFLHRGEAHPATWGRKEQYTEMKSHSKLRGRANVYWLLDLPGYQGHLLSTLHFFPLDCKLPACAAWLRKTGCAVEVLLTQLHV